MKKFYRIIVLLLVLIFLTTYSPNELNISSNKSSVVFKVRNVLVKDNHIIDKNIIIEKLKAVYGSNIFLVKRKDIEKPLKSIDFLEKIEVKKKYPDTIILKIYETKPVAIFFKKNQKYVLDSSSNLITFSEKIFFKNLPNIIGEGAEQNFVNFLILLKNNNFPEKRVKNYHYFQIDRWDLQLLNGQLIKLPSNKTESAIKQSIILLGRKDFKNYKVIDLRIDGKVVVE